MAAFNNAGHGAPATGDFMEIELSIHCRDLKKVRSDRSDQDQASNEDFPVTYSLPR